MKRVLILFLVILHQFVSGYAQSEKLVLIKTSLGDIKVKLYNETPKHRDNFLKLVGEKYYDSILFHRVIKNFMIQAGDPVSKHAATDVQLGEGGPAYTIPAEFNPKLYHKKGVLAAAREGDDVNPLQASSGSQFYIVQGKVMTDQELAQVEIRVNTMRKYNRMRRYLMLPENSKMLNDISFSQGAKQDSLLRIVGGIVDTIYKKEPLFILTPEQREVYKAIGGTPHLDTNYTVFGEVIEGLDIVDKIASVKTGAADRPLEDVRIITMTVLN